MKLENKSLSGLLALRKQKQFARDAGTEMHIKMQHITIDKNLEKGDQDIIQKIKSIPGLFMLFSKNSRTEIPIAGIINGHFVSRRIDRMIVSDSQQSIMFMDYKTDSAKEPLYEKYVSQINEYASLLRKVYPKYSIRGFILWTHDFALEEIS